MFYSPKEDERVIIALVVHVKRFMVTPEDYCLIAIITAKKHTGFDGAQTKLKKNTLGAQCTAQYLAHTYSHFLFSILYVLHILCTLYSAVPIFTLCGKHTHTHTHIYAIHHSLLLYCICLLKRKGYALH